MKWRKLTILCPHCMNEPSIDEIYYLGDEISVEGFCHKCDKKFTAVAKMNKATAEYQPLRPPMPSKEDRDFMKEMGIVYE